jgi:hypothetical protein
MSKVPLRLTLARPLFPAEASGVDNSVRRDRALHWLYAPCRMTGVTSHSVSQHVGGVCRCVSPAREHGVVSQTNCRSPVSCFERFIALQTPRWSSIPALERPWRLQSEPLAGIWRGVRPWADFLKLSAWIRGTQLWRDLGSESGARRSRRPGCCKVVYRGFSLLFEHGRHAPTLRAARESTEAGLA